MEILARANRGRWLAGLAAGLLAVGPVWADEPAGAVVELKPLEVEVEVDGRPVKMSEYWIGVTCQAPVPEPIRDQMGLKRGEGVLVGAVIPEGPAAKAGIKEHDVLVKAGDKPLRIVQDLIDAVDAAKQSRLSIDLYRGDKRMTIEVQPMGRPADFVPDVLPPGSEWDQMRKWLERFRPGEDGKPPLRFRFFHPGTILPHDAAAQPPLPDNMSISITREGGQPARIVVKKGDEKWELIESELDKLPADVRPHVERMLGRNWRFRSFDFVPQWDAPAAAPEAQAPTPEVQVPAPRVQPQPGPELPPPGASTESRVERRMEALERRFEQMRRSIEELRENRPRLKAPADQPKPSEEKKEKKTDQV